MTKVTFREARVSYTKRTVTTDFDNGIDGSKSVTIKQISSSADVASFMRHLIGNDVQESIWAILLDSRRRTIALHEVGKGGISGVGVSPADLFRAAVHAAASAMILVHNHPSDDASPSVEDSTFTERVWKGGKILGIDLLDHVIVTASDYYSFLDSGRISRYGSDG